jgi:hypothetical protein
MTVRLYDDITPNQNIILDQPFFEGAGTVAHDLSRQHNSGTFRAVGEPLWVQLASGLWVLQFDGADDNLTIPYNAVLVLGLLDFTLEFWANRTAFGWQGSILTQGQLAAVNFTVFFNNTDGSFALNRIPAGGVTSPPGATIGFTAGAWHHIVITRSAVNTWITYCDGQGFAMTGNTAINITNAGGLAFLIGALDNGAGGYNDVWNGRLSRPRLYLNYALTPAEVEAHYLAERGLYP